jgi:uncharacterized membrane protein YedE/YeeE
MKRILAGVIAGALFGAGLSVSGLIDPAKVAGFLDVAGAWDASLAFVMLGAVTVTAIGYRIVLRRSRPLFDAGFVLPTRTDIDPALALGAALFGIGWGLSGYCPGPALAGLGFGSMEAYAFVAAMLIGMGLARLSAPVFNRLARTPNAST